jgi:threonylcarbamoyladenosine tRNA methylthiotransferase MtaB
MDRVGHPRDPHDPRDPRDPQEQQSIGVETFGCKVNSYDSGLIQQQIAGHDWRDRAAAAAAGRKVHVLNTCAVTAEATHQALRRARKLKREDPTSFVVVTGCSAQVDTEKFATQECVDLIVANSHKGELARRIEDLLAGRSDGKVFKSDIFKKEDLEGGGGEELHHTRSFLKIQDGCDSFCTFCVIPFARGKSRSLEAAELAARINELEARGAGEVVLTGVHIGDYLGCDGRDLAGLVEFLLDHTTMARIRLSSLEPIELNERLLALYANPRLCRHFHMSIQSASTTVLERMKRKYTAGQVVESLNVIRDRVPGAFVGMDVIAGFPEETEAEFTETLTNLERAPWTRMHVFPYSARPLTYAARTLKGIRPELIKARAKKLREMSRARHQEAALRQIGRTKQVMILGQRQSPAMGLSRDFWPVALENMGGRRRGEEVTVQIRGSDREESPSQDLLLYADAAFDTTR